MTHDHQTPEPGHTYAAGEQKPASPLDLLMDRLRGRWKYAIPLAIVLAFTGAAAAYFLAPEGAYVSTGTIRVESHIAPILGETPETGSLPGGYSTYLATQMDLLRDERTISMALRDEGLKRSPFAAPGGRQKFRDSISVQTASRNSSLVIVEFRAESPQLAQASLKAILSAFMEIQEEANEYRKTVAELGTQRERILGDRTLQQEKRREFIGTSSYAKFNIDGMRERFFQQHLELEGQLETIDRLLSSAAANDEFVGPPAPIEPTRSELEEYSPALRDQRTRVRQLQTSLTVREQELGQEHWLIRQLERELQAQRDTLATMAEEVRAEFIASRALLGSDGRDRAHLEEEAGRVRTAIDEVEDHLIALNEEQAALETFEREIGLLDSKLAGIDNRLAGLEGNKLVLEKGRSDVISEATLPQMPEEDKRRKLAIVGFLGGAALPFALFVLIGTIDRRAFDSSQLRSSDSGCECIGVLPDLTRAENDESAKTLASQCVHRLRNRIEVQRRPGEGFVAAITSPYQGDGKTSVAFALAWSYAAAQCRTLLVDFDFVGRALSYQAGVLTREGVKECLARHAVNGQIQRIDGTNLDILGVGCTDRLGPESLKSPDVTWLMNELREQYDLIIVDTGPLLGSVEALPVIGACDAAVLTLRRGRPKNRLIECVREIHDTGAACLGVILNCAAPSDCSRYSSVSRVSADVERALADERRGTAGAPAHAQSERYHLIRALHGQDHSDEGGESQES